ncbi:unnamed protein product [Prorocentrum cordatum]|uniref:Uncharacterized protein n=1 Tax=Prorocentrum cordatum TaxID=2364126 RepID=A0ABN9R568_9DINO|nr:unnamed protein product [Polarella glacialis]
MIDCGMLGYFGNCLQTPQGIPSSIIATDPHLDVIEAIPEVDVVQTRLLAKSFLDHCGAGIDISYSTEYFVAFTFLVFLYDDSIWCLSARSQTSNFAHPALAKSTDQLLNLEEGRLRTCISTGRSLAHKDCRRGARFRGRWLRHITSAAGP